jgi:ketosteroid isomerase-like protein
MENTMNAEQPIDTPITGREDRSDLDDPVQALAQFHAAFNGRDLDLMAQNWAQDGFVAMDNPVGGIKRGWPQIRAVYQGIFRSPARVEVEFHDYTLRVVGDLFYAVGRERGALEAPGVRLDLRIRTSRLFQRMDGRWRQVHHHGSMDDARLLDAYQKAVR